MRSISNSNLAFAGVLGLVVACSSSSADEAATDPGAANPKCGSAGHPACPGAGGASGGGVGNDARTGVACGAASDTKCADRMACMAGDDCASGVCGGGTCQAPSGTDGVKNGDETDVDCGGITTGAPRCDAGRACNAHTDCASDGCAYDGTCAEFRSCTEHFGGDTCGTGEVGSGEENHESCCRTLPVADFTDAAQPDKTVYLDKYEVTAGRIRTFLGALTVTYGRPDVKRWITEHAPERWKDAWTQYLPSDTDAEDTALGNVGTNYAFGAALYVYVHGHNCFHGARAYGYSTYWYPPDVMQNQNGGLARAVTQEELDVKAMTCIPNAVLAAFCVWDGGQLATAEVLNAVTANGSRLPPLNPAVTNVSADSGASSSVYSYPPLGAGVTSEGVSRIAAPGRIEADRVSIGGAEPWMDLRGNLNEVALSGSAFALLYQGIGFSSARALNNPNAIPLPYYKAGYSGGRCMRFK